MIASEAEATALKSLPPNQDAVHRQTARMMLRMVADPDSLLDNLVVALRDVDLHARIDVLLWQASDLSKENSR